MSTEFNYSPIANLLQNNESTLDFHPKTFDDYLGQPALKKKLTIFCTAAKQRQEPLDHLLLFGPPGLGKTTIALIMAETMGVPITICNGPMLERTGDIVSVLSSLEPRSILFIDEIHRVPIVVEEVLYNAMEHFKVDIIVGKGAGAKSVNLPINPFTLVGATTKSGLISAPLTTRFGIIERLDYYSLEELAAITMQNARYLDISITIQGAQAIAGCARGTPRVAKKLLRRVRDYAQVHAHSQIDAPFVHQSLADMGIDQEGLTTIDHRIIATLQQHGGGPLGLDTLSHIIGEDPHTIETVYEPFLMRLGILERTPRGRALTQRYTHNYQQSIT